MFENTLLNKWLYPMLLTSMFKTAPICSYVIDLTIYMLLMHSFAVLHTCIRFLGLKKILTSVLFTVATRFFSFITFCWFWPLKQWSENTDMYCMLSCQKVFAPKLSDMQ